MKRLLACFSCLLLMLCLCQNVSAADTTRATSVNIMATVSASGSGDVTSTVTLHLAEPLSRISYPVPLNASNVTLNGKPVFTEKSGQARQIDLSRTLGGIAGDFSFTVGYTVNSAVTILPDTTTAPTEEEDTENTDPTEPAPLRVQLDLPLLAGFAYPIDQLQFSINLPAPPEQNPSFVSGYHQTSIEKDLVFSLAGGNIAGHSRNFLKDHETLNMQLITTDAMFPQDRVELPEAERIIPFVGILAGLALVFWILFLRNYLPIRNFPPVAPEGLGAGQFCTVLTLAGADLNLMTFSWAQLGYVTLRMDRRGKVTIQRRMDMGNERTPFEQRCFSYLFSRKDLVDTSSKAYQRAVQMVRLQRSVPQFFRGRFKSSLLVKIFRCIAAAAGLLSGTCFGIFLGNLLDYGWIFIVALSLAGLVCSWNIHFWPQGLFLHHRLQLWIAAALCLLWLAIGIAIGQFPLALLAVAIQVVAGFLAAFGGRRTEDGRVAMGQTLRLRRYLTRLSVPQAQQLLRDNPEVFFDLVPYALALGCNNAFARRFGKSRLPVCPYIQISDAQSLTALQWSQLMRQLLDSMAASQRKRPSDVAAAILRNYMQ